MAAGGALCAFRMVLPCRTRRPHPIFDALDGALARATGAASTYGAFFDSFLDLGTGGRDYGEARHIRGGPRRPRAPRSRFFAAIAR